MNACVNYKVSVIVPSYNSFETIETTIRSILSQTYNDLEVIVVDDCSTELGIDNVQRTFQSEPYVKFLLLDKNCGVWNARNVGMEFAQGRFIAFCDADDVWYPHKLEKQLNILSLEEADIVFSSYDIIDAFGKGLGTRFIEKDHLSYSDMLNYNHIGNLTAVLDTQKFGVPAQQKFRDGSICHG